MLALAKHLGAPLETYLEFEHPVQQKMLEMLSHISGVPAGRIEWGIDGCGLPSFAIPLRNMALMMARLTNPVGLPDDTASACRRITSAIQAYPLMIAGHERYCTDFLQATGGRVLEKVGANGVSVLGVMGRHMGAAIQIDDGEGQPAYAAFMIHLLHSLDVLTGDEVKTLERWSTLKVYNERKDEVGRLEFVQGL